MGRRRRSPAGTVALLQVYPQVRNKPRGQLPIAGVSKKAPYDSIRLLNNFICQRKHPFRDVDAQRLRGLEIDDR
jgi:hypothetical protein